ncbi:MAG: DUF1016 domain-containing protein [Desulfobacterales bacterium]|nr:DUF1016 domain-containing protein [Desulfobacterales bacterium]
MNEVILYGNLLNEIKKRIQQAQAKAVLSVNAEMILMYWDIGRIIYNQQQKEGWGTGVITRLSRDIRNELPKQKGFSERNIKFMVQLYKEYEGSIGKQPVSQLEKRKQLISQIPWGHTILLMQRLKDHTIRFWYMMETIKNGWSRDTLASMIKLRCFMVIELKKGEFKPEPDVGKLTSPVLRGSGMVTSLGYLKNSHGN